MGPVGPGTDSTTLMPGRSCEPPPIKTNPKSYNRPLIFRPVLLGMQVVRMFSLSDAIMAMNAYCD
jgi:hypothetical protein